MNKPTTETLRAMLDDITRAEASEEHDRTTMLVQIPIFTRWLYIHAPHLFQNVPTHITDEPGYCDSTYPPDEYFAECSKTKLFTLRKPKLVKIPRESGTYYAYDIGCIPGLYVDRHGTLYRAHVHGSGRFSDFQAYAGDQDRDIHIDYPMCDTPDLADLSLAVEKLWLAYSYHLSKINKG